MWTAALLAVLILPACSSREDGQDIPSQVEVPSGNALKVRYHAVGLQTYTWNASIKSWGPPAPIATLFLGDVLHGSHSEGPTWQNSDGSKIVGAKISSVTVDATAIPWLLIKATSTSGPGLFDDVTFVQRINTSGGLVPAGQGATDGAQVQVHYQADYLFYHRQ
jgi:hypothetical protein